MAQEVILRAATTTGLIVELGSFGVDAYWGEVLQAVPFVRWRKLKPLPAQRHDWKTAARPAPGNWEER